MAEITKETTILNIKNVLKAFIKKIVDAKNYIEFLPLEGREIVENYDSNKDKTKDLLNESITKENFFEGLTNEELIDYANTCYELNEQFDLRVRNLCKVTKIINLREKFYFKNGVIYIDARQTELTLSEIFPKLFCLDYYSNIQFYTEIATLLGIEDLNNIFKIYQFDFNQHPRQLFKMFMKIWGNLDDEKIIFLEKFDEEHGTKIVNENIPSLKYYYLEKLLNKNNLFSGTYKYLNKNSIKSYCSNTYINSLGYFIDFSTVQKLKQKSIEGPSFTTIFDEEFKKPTYSFFIEPTGLSKFNNIMTGISLGMSGMYVKINPPRYFNTSNVNQSAYYENSYLYTEDGNRDNGLDSFRKKANKTPLRPMKGSIHVPGDMRAKSNIEFFANKLDKVSSAGGAAILAEQTIIGAISAYKLNTLYINVWNTNIDKINFFTVQVPRCKNLNMIYDYEFLSTNDDDYKKIMRNL